MMVSGSFLPPSPPRAPPSQVDVVTPSFQSLVDPPFMCVFSHLPIFYIWFFLL